MNQDAERFLADQTGMDAGDDKGHLLVKVNDIIQPISSDIHHSFSHVRI